MRILAVAALVAACTSRSGGMPATVVPQAPDAGAVPAASDAGGGPATSDVPDAGTAAAACPSIAPPQGLCEESWCWDYPVPFGYHLSAVAAGTGDDLWVGGESMIARRSRGVWAMWPAPGNVTRLWISPSGVPFALVEGSGVQRFDQGRWSMDLAGARDVSFTGAATAFALHDAAIARWDGTKWTDAYTPSAAVRSIVAVNATDVWAASGDVFVHFDGSAWTETPHGFTSIVATGPGQWRTEAVDLSTMLYTPGGDLWAAGGCGGLAVHDTAGWRLVASPFCGWRSQGHLQVTGVAGPREDAWFTVRDVWYEGARAIYTDNFARLNANGTFERTAADRSIAAIASTPSGAYAVGLYGAVWKQDGASWSRILGGAGAVSALAVDACGRALAAAYLGSSMFPTSARFLRNEGAGWVDDGPGSPMFTLVAPSIDDAWGVPAFDGTLLHRTAQGWAPSGGPSTVNVSASGARDVWASWTDTWHFDGASWMRTPIALDRVDLLWTRAPDDAWAIRMGQRLDVSGLWHWDGSAWKPAVGPPVYATSLAGDSTGPWIAGVDSLSQPTNFQTLFHLRDQEWEAIPVSSGSPNQTPHVQVTAGGDVFVSASNLPPGQMLRWTGTSFVPVKSGIVASDREGHLWLSNGRGILRPR